MKPVKQWDFFTINIDDDCYQQDLEEFQDCLIGRIMMSPDDKTYSMFELGKKLHEIWNVKGTLNLIPHSRGYYTIRFSSLEDCNRIFRRRHWVLQPGPSVCKTGSRNLIPTRSALPLLKSGSGYWTFLWNISNRPFWKLWHRLLAP
ncbi:hypothetical protein ACS0TY_032197 [Phlomoides rotata]